MSEPLNSAVEDSGLNSSDTQAWDTRRDAVKVPWYLTFGALFLAAGVVFLIVVIAFKLNEVFQAKPAAVADAPPAAVNAAAAPVAPVIDKDAEIAALRRQLALLQAQPLPATTAAPPVYTADPTALAQLSARLERVEANQRALAHAAMVANAAAALETTARSGAPFAGQLAALEPALNDPTLVAPLKAYADKGVPTAVDLAVRYRTAAAKANIASKGAAGDGSLLSKALHAMGSFISIRRTDNTEGQGTEAILQLAENRMHGGDLAGAVAYLDTLKPPAHKALEPWLADARARLLVDSTTGRIAASALGRLAQVNAAPAEAQTGATL